MKLLRLRVDDPDGFRSLPSGFEHHFRTEWELKDELDNGPDFAPFVCAGRNGSGKSNLLEILAAIFFQLELQRVRRSFLPDELGDDEVDSAPSAYLLEYLINVPLSFGGTTGGYARVRVVKEIKSPPRMYWLNPEAFPTLAENLPFNGLCGEREREYLLPEYVLGYSSGENEILSLPFFKMRFVQFDEYWNCLKEQQSYPGHPDTRLAFLDSGFSQAILLCNFLFQDKEALLAFREDVGIEELKEFRIIIRRSVVISADVAAGFGKDHPAIFLNEETGELRINLMHLLEAGHDSADNFDPVVTRLKRCATCWYAEEVTDSLILDFWVNKDTKDAFRDAFDFESTRSPIMLFQAFRVLLTLNLYSVSGTLKTDLYRSSSHYVGETVPTLASDQRIMRFKFVQFTKRGVEKPMMLKELSDGEYQLLHSLGLCLLFRGTNSLFLLDEPETHFNPDWRANFITRLGQCLSGTDHDKAGQEMLITTHTPFLISDCRPEKVLVFKVDGETGKVGISHPDYNTLGASINKITIKTFETGETIGGRAQRILEGLRKRFEGGEEDSEKLISEIEKELGDSVEKILLVKAILDKRDQGGREGRR